MKYVQTRMKYVQTQVRIQRKHDPRNLSMIS